jgi:hypothetical protein
MVSSQGSLGRPTLELRQAHTQQPAANSVISELGTIDDRIERLDVPPYRCETCEAGEHYIKRRPLAIRSCVRASDVSGGIRTVDTVESLCGYVDAYDVCDALTLIPRQSVRGTCQ